MLSMDKYIKDFPLQLSEALDIGRKIPSIKSAHKIRNILICGMGGSGIGGALVREYVAGRLKVPLEVNNDYDLPDYAGKHTLIISSSYSGDTEETLSAMKSAMKRKCSIVCISSGGKMAAIAQEKNIPLVKIPGGMPPRTCLGYSFIAELAVLWKAGFIKDNFISEVESSIALIRSKRSSIQKKAKALAGEIYRTIPAIYISVGMKSMAMRWKQQMNENAKMLAHANAIPELNHNELVGYHDKYKNVSVIFLRHRSDAAPIQKRFELTEAVIAKKAAFSQTIFSEGDSYMEKLIYFLHFGDWLTLYMAELRNVDPIKIDVLDKLKKDLKGAE